ncbi:MAG: glycosyltransferase family 4 protein [Myxococcales bacterium]|nr:glycosyltransferase family 4 protein [Myxococcales bacterium]
MKIAYLTSQYARAADTFIRREVRGLREMGHEVHTFSARRAPGQDISEEVKQEQANTLYLTEQPVPKLAWSTIKMISRRPSRFAKAAKTVFTMGSPGVKNRVWQLAYLMEASLMAEELESRGVEHIHNHIAQASATVALLASELSGIPYSLTVHGPHIFFEPKTQNLGLKVSKSAFTACITQFCKSQVKIFTPHEHWSKLAIVHCGLDETFLGAPPTPVPNKPQVLTIGRLSEEKGQLDLVEVIADLKNEGVAIELVVVGDGPMRGSMEALAKSLGVENHIHFKGWKSSEEVRNIIEASRIMLHPSFAEGLPVVIMEALALGRPVIASRIAGIPELVVDKESGWIVTPGDKDDTRRALREAMQMSSEQLSSMGLAGRRRVEEHHDNRKETLRLSELIETLGGRGVNEATTTKTPSSLNGVSQRPHI